MSGTQQLPLLFRFDALGLLAVPLGCEVLLPDVHLAILLRVLQLGTVVAIVALAVFAEDLPFIYKIVKHVVDALVLLQLPVLVVQFMARHCLGVKSEIYRRATSTPIDPCTEFCGELTRLLVAEAALHGTMSDKMDKRNSMDIGPRDLLNRLQDAFAGAIGSGTLKISDLERMGAILFRHLVQDGQNSFSCSDLVGSSCCTLLIREPKWTGSLVRAADFLARDMGVSARLFRQLLDADDATQELNTEVRRRDTLFKTASEQPEEEMNGKVYLQGLEDKVSDFLSQFMKRIEKMELHARELSDTLVRQLASLERRWTDAKQRIDSLMVNPNDPASVSGKNFPGEQNENDDLAPSPSVHYQDLARRIDLLVCRIAALELSNTNCPIGAPGTNERVNNGGGCGAPRLKPTVSELVAQKDGDPLQTSHV